MHVSEFLLLIYFLMVLTTFYLGIAILWGPNGWIIALLLIGIIFLYTITSWKKEETAEGIPVSILIVSALLTYGVYLMFTRPKVQSTEA